MKLSQFLETLDILGAKPGKDYVGTKSDNPAMVLEEKTQGFTRTTDIEDIQESLRIFQEKVCIPGFPARYSPQFWLAHAALSAIYEVLCSHLQAHFDPDLQQETNQLLFQLWAELITAGPGSTHLEMMNIILKNEDSPLWKYMETLDGEQLCLLISTLKTDFVYVEEVSADHYACLMETHIDKIFRSILSLQQLEECRRELLDLSLYYLGKMNHVPPHIGPRLSHLCFLIFNRYHLENPYVGVDDWVLTRTHLRVIKEVITHQNFTIGTEAQYRAPITLEKLFEAAVIDRMLEIMFKDFMNLLLQLCNYGNCRKCKCLFVAYQSGLFEQLDFKKGFEKHPDWLFDQCIGALSQVVNLNTLESQLDRFIISTEHLCLLHFSTLSVGQVAQWHKLLVNHVVSGRALLVGEVGKLLESTVLQEAQVFNWKTNVDSGRMFVDIISDLPWTFIQDDADSCLTDTVEQYSCFLQALLTQFRDQGVAGRYTDVVNRCVLKCTDHAKSAITLVCLQSDICDFMNTDFIREVLFTMDELFKDLDFSTSSGHLSEAVLLMLTQCLAFFREKGYIAVDFNSLLISICVACAAASDSTIPDTDNSDMAVLLYNNVVIEFIKLHAERGSLNSVSSLVPQLIQAIQECIQQETGWGRCVDLLSELGTRFWKLLTDHTHSMMELLLDWGCLDVQGLLLQMYSQDRKGFVSHFQSIFTKLPEFEVEDRHLAMELLSAMSQDQTQLFSQTHISHLLTLYPDESLQTQCHILDIVKNVANKGTSLLTASHFNMLTDAAKFSPLSLRQRAPILVQMSHQNEDVRRQTLEHLMQYIGHNDRSVCLVAMETLVPLLKDTPGYVQKHRMKFKNLWKTSNMAEVKDLCAELLPDIKYSGKKPEVKEPAKKASKVISTPARGKPVLNKSGLKGREASTMSANTAFAASRISSVPSVAASTKTAPVSTPSDGGSLADTGRVTSPTTVDRAGDTGLQEETKPSHINTSPLPAKEIIGAGASTVESHVGATTEQKPEQSHSKKLDQGELETVKRPVSIKILTESNVSDRDKNSLIDEFVPAEEIVLKVEDTEKAEYKVESDPITTEISPTSPDCSVLEWTDSSPLKPPVQFRLIGGQNIEVLVNTLRSAGYDSYVSTDKTETEYEHSKVVVYCIWDFSLTVAESVISEIDLLQSHQIPVIVLRMQKFTSVQRHAKLKGMKKNASIRFYLKDGEHPFKGGNWSQAKFCELLMQLSYSGVLQDEQLVKPDFRNLWSLAKPASTEKQAQSGNVTMTTAMPEVFISYHWGKQNQVEPLYQLLSGLGVRCWMSVYHMSGSESLYNQIAQGIHSCRVMLACITNNYTHSLNCQQEITIAQKLNKPIIPMVLGETKWPTEGEIGKRLAKLELLRINLTAERVVDTSAVAMKKLLQKLSSHVTIQHSRETTPPDNGEDSKVQEDGDKETNDCSNEKDNIQEKPLQVSSRERRVINNRYSKRSSSMFEIKKTHRQLGGRTRRSDSVIEKTDIPSGVIVDDMGYTVKSERSKSCLIL